MEEGNIEYLNNVWKNFKRQKLMDEIDILKIGNPIERVYLKYLKDDSTIYLN